MEDCFPVREVVISGEMYFMGKSLDAVYIFIFNSLKSIAFVSVVMERKQVLSDRKQI
jgi:hypothetical protein